jgi:hypothetical protein
VARPGTGLATNSSQAHIRDFASASQNDDAAEIARAFHARDVKNPDGTITKERAGLRTHVF